MKIRGGHENGRQLDSLHFYRVPWPPRSGRQKHLRASEGLFRKSFENQRVLGRGSPARFTAFLQGPVATSTRTPKTPSSFRGSLSQKFLKSEGATKRVASSIHCIFTGCRGHLEGGQNEPPKKASKLRSFFEKLFSASRSADGGPKAPRRWPQARLTAFLQGEMRRPD